MDTPKTIIISTSIPKYIAKINSGNASINPGNCVLASSNIRKSSSILTKTTPVSCVGTIENITSSAMFSEDSVSAPSRKRRLDHLSFEEKMQRKKLKNRMAAQSSRDRKKARMDELEAEVKELRQKNTLLSRQCANLQNEKQLLVEENEDLRRKLVESQTSSVSCSPLVAGPAVSNAIDPQQQGQGLQLALGLATMLLLSLPFRICLVTWREMTTSLTLKSLQTACLEKLLMNWLESKGKERLLVDVKKKEVLLKWWGRHQKMWNPIED